MKDHGIFKLFFVDYLFIENKHIVDGGGCWWLVAGQEKCWTGEMLDRRDSGQERLWTGEMLGMRDAGHERRWTGEMLGMRDGGQERCWA